MRLHRLSCLFAALGLAGLACSDGVAPDSHAVTSVVVERDTLVATVSLAGEVTWMRFTVPATIDNQGPAAVGYSTCYLGIAMPAGAGVHLVWSPLCSLELTAPLVIEPGETRHLDVQVSAALEGPGGPKWNSESVEGDYRLAVGLIPTGARGVVPMVLSNAFTLVVEP